MATIAEWVTGMATVVGIIITSNTIRIDVFALERRVALPVLSDCRLCFIVMHWYLHMKCKRTRAIRHHRYNAVSETRAVRQADRQRTCVWRIEGRVLYQYYKVFHTDSAIQLFVPAYDALSQIIK